MIRISSLFVVGILGTSIAFAQEEPPPPVEGWTLLTSGETSANEQVILINWETNGVPGHYNYSTVTNIHNVVVQTAYEYGHPTPTTSPTWRSELSTLLNMNSQQSYSGSVECHSSHQGFIVSIIVIEGAMSQLFSYNLWPYDVDRVRNYRTAPSVAQIVHY
ncbi:hypothetical protein QPK87_09640 [Kamptonema cortianum]|nr:hypothetical protein [Geitlerinema splendidum]MDK3156836.1 hypothetical protein [Kamptonema cortianum]